MPWGGESQMTSSVGVPDIREGDPGSIPWPAEHRWVQHVYTAASAIVMVREYVFSLWSSGRVECKVPAPSLLSVGYDGRNLSFNLQDQLDTPQHTSSKYGLKSFKERDEDSNGGLWAWSIAYVGEQGYQGQCSCSDHSGALVLAGNTSLDTGGVHTYRVSSLLECWKAFQYKYHRGLSYSGSWGHRYFTSIQRFTIVTPGNGLQSSTMDGGARDLDPLQIVSSEVGEFLLCSNRVICALQLWRLHNGS